MIFTQSYCSSFMGDDFGGCVAVDALETVDRVDAMMQRNFVEVDDVPEVPTHDAAASLDTGEGNVQGVGGHFRVTTPTKRRIVKACHPEDSQQARRGFLVRG